MAHEITNTDQMMYTGETPWHGMGVSMPSHCTPREAMQAAGLDWTVEAAPLYWQRPDQIEAAEPVEDRVQLYRSDTADPLGIVSTDYVPFQNSEIVDFIGEVLGDDFAAVETAGSLRGGRRVWFLLDQGRHDIAGVDPVAKYSLFASGHDGTLSFRVLSTPIRVVCANTFRAAGADGHKEGLSIPHRGDMAAAIDAARHALAGTLHMHEEFIQAGERLAARQISSEWVRQFFWNAYVRRIASHDSAKLLQARYVTHDALAPADEAKADRAENRMRRTIDQWMQNYEDHDGGEASSRVYGTAWHALNSVTRWVNHQRPRVSDRVESNLIGGGASIVQSLTSDALEAVEALV